ncbi:MAG: HlyD family efflux transporter periplasmic adaptor subunit, partial [Nitrospinota bacterium]
AFKIPGKLVELAVEEGTEVTKGMIVARLDQEQLLRQRDRAQAALAVAQSRLTQLETEIRFREERLARQLEQQRAAIAQAEANLRALLAGSRTQEIKAAQAAVEQARAEYERAQSDWKRAEELFRRGIISVAEHDRMKSWYEASAAALKQAEERLALVKEGPRQETIEAARAQVKQAKAALRLLEAARLELEMKRQERATRQAEVERARAELALVESQLRDTVARSPVDGVVLAKVAEVGEVLAAGATVVTIGDIAHPWLRGYIDERDLGRVKWGAKVRVRTDSFPDKVYWGRVSFIASEAEFTPKQIQTPEERVKLVYRVKIDIPNPDHELKLNMPVEAEILLEEGQG